VFPIFWHLEKMKSVFLSFAKKRLLISSSACFSNKHASSLSLSTQREVIFCFLLLSEKCGLSVVLSPFLPIDPPHGSARRAPPPTQYNTRYNEDRPTGGNLRRPPYRTRHVSSSPAVSHRHIFVAHIASGMCVFVARRIIIMLGINTCIRRLPYQSMIVTNMVDPNEWAILNWIHIFALCRKPVLFQTDDDGL